MKETELSIRVFPDPVLAKVAKPVKEITSHHRKILSEMAQLMYEASGVGLAAPQVGISEALIVVDAGSGLYKLINPRIIIQEGTQANEEGCLSVPGITIKVKRAKKITLCAMDESAKEIIIEAEDLLACVFQHELDHLNGKLIIDYGELPKPKK
ncbi:MAG: peptide deformylase [Candidatus Omnitrophica bacterium]|jgi:peptide deformylase|nr:peptide deformylase [Candidatus Omnitrophota bacterium]